MPFDSFHAGPWHSSFNGFRCTAHRNGLALHCTAHSSGLALHCTELHFTTLHYSALLCTALHCTSLHTSLHCVWEGAGDSPKNFYFYFFIIWVGGLTNERPGTNHVISGPMGGCKKTASDGANTHTKKQTHGHRNSMTELAQWGRFSENASCIISVINRGDFLCP